MNVRFSKILIFLISILHHQCIRLQVEEVGIIYVIYAFFLVQNKHINYILNVHPIFSYREWN